MKHYGLSRIEPQFHLLTRLVAFVSRRTKTQFRGLACIVVPPQRTVNQIVGPKLLHQIQGDLELTFIAMLKVFGAHAKRQRESDRKARISAKKLEAMSKKKALAKKVAAKKAAAVKQAAAKKAEAKKAAAKKANAKKAAAKKGATKKRRPCSELSEP